MDFDANSVVHFVSPVNLVLNFNLGLPLENHLNQKGNAECVYQNVCFI